MMEGVRAGSCDFGDNSVHLVLKDKQIRTLLKKRLSNRHGAGLPIVEEMKISKGQAYPDLVAFFQHPHCYEIKSSVDTLRRLHSQMEHYQTYFSKVTIVSAENHANRVIEQTPEWVGVTVIKDSSKMVTLRKCGMNPGYKPLALLDLLWKDELLELNRDVLGEEPKKALSKAELIKRLALSKRKTSVREGALKKIIDRMKNMDRLSEG